MSRAFRVYEKKRGHRRTGSRWLGTVGETVFLTAVFLLGCGGLVLVWAIIVIPEWRVNHDFRPATCTVLDKRIAQDSNRFRPEIQIRYEVDGESVVVWTYDILRRYTSGEEEKRAVLDGFVRGEQYPCWYDPAQPSRAVLVRGYSWLLWSTLAVPVSFLMIGGGGLVYAVLSWGKSAERRAAQPFPGLALLPGNDRTAPEYPSIPGGADFTNSPGTALAFRLPVTATPTWRLFVWLVACLLWNGAISVFAAVAINGHLEGRPDWVLTAFTVPFVLIGLGMAAFFVRQVLMATAVGPTLVEISSLPLYPGGQYELFFTQSGRLRMNRLEILLACDEEATYVHGTNTRAETQRVWEEPVFCEEHFEIQRGAPFEGRCAIEIPTLAMHSFKAEHNEVAWKIVVRGEAAGWPPYQRTFPVLVYPAPSRQAYDERSRQLEFRLDDVGRIYQPSDTLSGDCRVQGAAGEEIRAVEISVLWHTEGKGEEDFAVHYFRRLAAEDQPGADMAGPHAFSTLLPNSPLSYRGLIVKVHWCVRARAFFSRGQEAVAEVSFRLGQVHRAAVLPP